MERLSDVGEQTRIHTERPVGSEVLYGEMGAPNGEARIQMRKNFPSSCEGCRGLPIQRKPVGLHAQSPSDSCGGDCETQGFRGKCGDGERTGVGKRNHGSGIASDVRGIPPQPLGAMHPPDAASSESFGFGAHFSEFERRFRFLGRDYRQEQDDDREAFFHFPFSHRKDAKNTEKGQVEVQVETTLLNLNLNLNLSFLCLSPRPLRLRGAFSFSHFVRELQVIQIVRDDMFVFVRRHQNIQFLQLVDLDDDHPAVLVRRSVHLFGIFLQ